MGREIRRVPPNWEHPKKDYPNHRLGTIEEGYQPLYDRDLESAWERWLSEFQEWVATEGDRVRAEYGEADYPKDQPYRAFCKWDGQPPDPEYYRPRWSEEEATWFQVYETVSEGTPVTPPFATREELIDYLCTHGDFWDQRRRKDRIADIRCGPWSREAATAFVNRGFAFSMMVETGPSGTTIKEPRDGI